MLQNKNIGKYSNFVIYESGDDLVSGLKPGDKIADFRLFSIADSSRHLLDFQGDVISEKTKIGLNEARLKGNMPGRPRKPDSNVHTMLVGFRSNVS